MRVSHLAAVATLVALLGAMFVALPSASAATGDVSANKGYCVQTGDGADAKYWVSSTTASLSATDDRPAAMTGTEVTVEVPDDSTDSAAGRDADDPKQPDHIRIECNSAYAGQAVTVTPDGSSTPVVTLAAPALSVRVNDTDGIVAAGGSDLTVTVSFKNVVQYTHQLATHRDNVAGNEVAIESTAYGITGGSPTETTQAAADGEAGIDLRWIRVSGELDDPTTPVGNWAATSNSLTAMLPIPAGTTPGEYTISALALYDPYSTGDNDDNDTSTPDAEDVSALTASTTITVGDPGTEADSVSLALGNASEDNPMTTARTGLGELIPEDGSEPASGGDVWLRVSAMNSMEEASNDDALNAITIIAPGATIAIHKPNATRSAPHATDPALMTGNNSASVTAKGNVVNTMFVKVKKADRKPGSVDVYALLIGKDGAPRSDTVSLNFTGASSSLSLGDPKPVAPGKMSEFTINAEDSAGNAGSIGQLLFNVMDADGKPVPESKIDVTKDTAGSSTPDKETDDNPLQTVGLIETANTTAPGVYTIETSLAGVPDSKATTEVTVSGAAANVAVEVAMSSDEVELGTILTVTATVTDKNGAPVADETTIGFATGGALTLDKVIASTKTKDGVGTGEFIVSKGEGLGVIIVTAGTGRATHTVSYMAPEEDEAMPEEEASVSCLSELSGFATWSCGVSADASEIFEMVSARGVSAIHLWNGSTWVRYSVVDDAMVPGSSDFMVTENDILYISN